MIRVLPALLFALLAPALRASVSRYASLAFDKQVRIEMDIPEALVVYAEPRLLDRVFDNLVQNAIRHSPDGGTVTLSGRHAPADSSSSTLRAAISPPPTTSVRRPLRSRKSGKACIRQPP
mgnify:CR=1 FL=1